MTEPCPACPEFVVRCGHLGEDRVTIYHGRSSGKFLVAVHLSADPYVSSLSPFYPTRAEADAEFDRREEALLT